MPNLLLRILSALVLLPPVLALIVWAPALAFAGVAVLLAGLSGYEFGSITLPVLLRSGRWLIAVLAAACCAAASAGPFLDGGASPLLPAILLLAPSSLLFYMFHPTEQRQSIQAAAFTVAGALYAGGLWAFVSLIRSADAAEGWRWLLLLLAAAVLTDTCAYAAGRLLGRRKLAPRISPKKTWAGAVGGALAAVGSVTLVRATLLPDLSWKEVAALGPLLGVFLQLGDLSESFLKRGFAVKDSGNLIPGHGGLLDRVDALLLGAPVVYLFLLWR
ncbi:MAG TPA: phosphatidate cytidylyltransferase [Polyangia bacterium]|nr:phosphatidate cytidylyltransferase [Polyangia bacterium]